MGNIINHFAEGAIHMEAGSTLNGDVHITGPIYQTLSPTNATEGEQPDDGAEKNLTQTAIDPQEMFHFVHPALEDEEAYKLHREIARLVERFDVQGICNHLRQLQNEGKLLLPQNVTIAYRELERMGMSTKQKGFDYKNFARYYNKR